MTTRAVQDGTLMIWSFDLLDAQHAVRSEHNEHMTFQYSSCQVKCPPSAPLWLAARNSKDADRPHETKSVLKIECYKSPYLKPVIKKKNISVQYSVILSPALCNELKPVRDAYFVGRLHSQILTVDIPPFFVTDKTLFVSLLYSASCVGPSQCDLVV